MKISAAYPIVSQFENGESAYECGFFTVALQKAAGEHVPALTAEQVDQLADRLYNEHNGSNAASNTSGMSLQEWWDCLDETGVHYQQINPSADAIVSALESGHAVCVTVAEVTTFDVDLGGVVPYAWKPTGNHIFTIVGAEPGVWLCNDQANIGPGGVRPWPRRYNSNRLAISLATAIKFPWLGNPTPVPPTPSDGSYTIKGGDTLWAIAHAHGQDTHELYLENASLLDQAAREHGHSSSNGGALIFPGTVIQL